MSWQRRINKALVRFTGFQVNRVGNEGISTASAPAKTTAVKAPPVKAKQTEAEIRPPADPKADRLLTAPIFIISPVRSGSTLLRSIMNAHSDLHAPHELHVRRLRVEFGTTLAAKAMEALGHNQADLEHLLWDRVLHRELVRSGKRYIVDKTPANAFAYDRISTCWPDARYIFLLRHPASIATSWYEASPDKRDREEAAVDALRYMKAVEKAKSALSGLTVRYEDLSAEPEKVTREICEFLGLEWEQGMLSYGEQTVIQKGLGDWRDKIRSGTVQPGRELPDADSVLDVLKPMCRTWGYLA